MAPTKGRKTKIGGKKIRKYTPGAYKNQFTRKRTDQSEITSREGKEPANAIDLKSVPSKGKENLFEE